MKEDEVFNTAHPDLPTYQQLYLMTFKLAAEYGTPYFDNQLPLIVAQAKEYHAINAAHTNLLLHLTLMTSLWKNYTSKMASTSPWVPGRWYPSTALAPLTWPGVTMSCSSSTCES
jgi:hypothetical protein